MEEEVFKIFDGITAVTVRGVGKMQCTIFQLTSPCLFVLRLRYVFFREVWLKVGQFGSIYQYFSAGG